MKYLNLSQIKLFMFSRLAVFHFCRTRIMTGIQPTGNLTLGNYIGSIQNLSTLQKKYPTSQIFMSIVDLHSLTTAFQIEHAQINYDGKIGKNTLQMSKTIIASGIIGGNQHNSHLFVQSHVKEHSELCWILGCIGPQHWLNFMIQYKQKSNQNSSLGIYAYPVLMAADILLYKANFVPVGEDQKQHLQLTKRYRQRFNSIAKKQILPVPQCVISQTPRVMSLTDPDKKMSKSDKNDRSRINLTDSKDQIALKIRKAKTDAQGHKITYDPENRKGLANLLKIYQTLTHKQMQQVLNELQNQSIGKFKQLLTEVIWKKLSKIQENMIEISDQEAKRILREGQQNARKVASQTIKEVKQILKLYQ